MNCLFILGEHVQSYKQIESKNHHRIQRASTIRWKIYIPMLRIKDQPGYPIPKTDEESGIVYIVPGVLAIGSR